MGRNAFVVREAIRRGLFSDSGVKDSDIDVDDQFFETHIVQSTIENINAFRFEINNWFDSKYRLLFGPNNKFYVSSEELTEIHKLYQRYVDAISEVSIKGLLLYITHKSNMEDKFHTIINLNKITSIECIEETYDYRVVVFLDCGNTHVYKRCSKEKSDRILTLYAEFINNRS
jgi:hypothetical protein